MLTYFNGSMYEVPGKMRMRTNEGPSAVREAIRFLGSMRPTTPLKWSDALYKAAKDLCKDQLRTGAMGHTGSDGSSMSDRINRYGSTNRYAENCAYGGQAG
jgi:uncharacterized protein YkwD